MTGIKARSVTPQIRIILLFLRGNCTVKQIQCVCVCVRVCACVRTCTHMRVHMLRKGVRRRQRVSQKKMIIIMDHPECLAGRFLLDLTVKKIHCNSLNQGRDHKSGVWGCLILQEELKDKIFGSEALRLHESELSSLPSLATESRITSLFLCQSTHSVFLFPIFRLE